MADHRFGGGHRLLARSMSVSLADARRMSSGIFRFPFGFGFFAGDGSRFYSWTLKSGEMQALH